MTNTTLPRANTTTALGIAHQTARTSPAATDTDTELVTGPAPAARPSSPSASAVADRLNTSEDRPGPCDTRQGRLLRSAAERLNA